MHQKSNTNHGFTFTQAEIYVPHFPNDFDVIKWYIVNSKVHFSWHHSVLYLVFHLMLNCIVQTHILCAQWFIEHQHQNTIVAILRCYVIWVDQVHTIEITLALLHPQIYNNGIIVRWSTTLWPLSCETWDGHALYALRWILEHNFAYSLSFEVVFC